MIESRRVESAAAFGRTRVKESGVSLALPAPSRSSRLRWACSRAYLRLDTAASTLDRSAHGLE
jgi:hypothetical protein